MLKVEERIIEFFKSQIKDLLLIYVFGSTVQNLTTIESDIDIAFLSSGSYTNVERFDLQEHLASIMKKDVDLIDLAQANDVIKMQIITKGKLLYFKDFNQKEQYENRAFQDYIFLKDNIKDLLEDIKKTGKVYG